MKIVVAILIVIALIPATVSFAQEYTVNTILEHTLAAGGDYPNGVFPIFNSMLVLVRSSGGNDDVSGIYDGRTGKLITPGYFNFRIGHHEETWFRQGADLAVIWSSDDEGLKFGFLDKNGRIAVPLIYDEVDDFVDGLAQAALDGKRGFINTRGEVVIPLNYDFDERDYLRSENRFHEDLAAVSIDGKWGFIDRSGSVVIPFEYDRAESFSEGMAAVQRDGLWGFINKAGELVVDFKYVHVRNFEDGISVVNTGSARVTGYEWRSDKSGIINKQGEVIFPIEYDSIGWFNEGLAEVLIGDRGPQSGKWGFVNTSGELVIPIIYNGSRSFENGLAKVSIGSWGRINTNGEVVIPLEYGWTWSLGEDLIAVSVKGTDEVKVYNTNGEVVFPAGMFDGYGSYRDGVLFAGIDDKWGLINLDGEIILPLEYGYSSFFSTWRATMHDGITLLEKDGKWGFATIKGEVITPPQYDFAEIHLNGFAWVAIGEDWHNVKCGYINRAGEFVIPLEYSRARYVGVENGVHYFWLEKDGLWGIVSVSGDYADGNPATGAPVSLLFILFPALIITAIFKKKGA